MDPIGILGILLSVLIALWQFRKAKLSENKLNDYLNQLPLQLVDNITRFLRDNSDMQPNGVTNEISNSNNTVKSSFTDIDNDGNEELLIQFSFAAHGSALQVYGMKNFEFQLISEISTDTPFGFDFEDIDKDGKLELRVIETNKSSGLPYVCGLRDVVWYRLEGKEFVEIKREEPLPDEIKDRLKEISK
jgi:hypothetical protein